MTVSTPGCAFKVTLFPDYAASTKDERNLSLEAIATLVRETGARRKHELPWLKMATFGTVRTDKNSLRHNANVLTVTGVEADYDAEQVPFETAVERVGKAGVLALVYTSPSHTPDAPRWRVLCPLSDAAPPAARDHAIGRLNGVFGGVVAGESWTLSQSYYYGHVGDKPAHQVAVVDGAPIDLLDDLDASWTGKPNTKPPPPRRRPDHGSRSVRAGFGGGSGAHSPTFPPQPRARSTGPC